MIGIVLQARPLIVSCTWRSRCTSCSKDRSPRAAASFSLPLRPPSQRFLASFATSFSTASLSLCDLVLNGFSVPFALHHISATGVLSIGSVSGCRVNHLASDISMGCAESKEPTGEERTLSQYVPFLHCSIARTYSCLFHFASIVVIF
jgi:hypothetical protein